MRQALEDCAAVLSEVSRNEGLVRTAAEIVDCVVAAFRRKNKLLLCGNGGSAAEAQHVAAEFVGRFQKERQALAAVSLTTDTSILTALANDYSYDRVFARQVEALGHPGDILIALSTSGNSANCIDACETARAMGLKTIAFTGASGGRLKAVADISFCVPASKTSHIQEVHLVVLHAVCELAEKAFS